MKFIENPSLIFFLIAFIASRIEYIACRSEQAKMRRTRKEDEETLMTVPDPDSDLSKTISFLNRNAYQSFYLHILLVVPFQIKQTATSC